MVSHFNILFDERKGKESVCDNGRKKEDSDPNGKKNYHCYVVQISNSNGSSIKQDAIVIAIVEFRDRDHPLIF